MPKPHRDTILLTRLYATPTGQIGVCYAYADGGKGATLLPTRLEHEESIKRHIEATLSVKVARPNNTLERFYQSDLARLVAGINPSSQARMLSMGREDVLRLSTSAGNTVQARVKSQTRNTSYVVTLTKPSPKGKVTARCTCEAHKRNRSVTCKHIGVVCLTLMMRLDLGKENAGGTRGLICVDEAGYGLKSAFYRHTHTRHKCVRIVGANGEARWVSIDSILITQAIPSHGEEDAYLEIATLDSTPMPEALEFGGMTRATRHA